MDSIKSLTLTLLIIVACTSCTPFTVVTTGAQAAYNRHNIKKTLDDGYINMQACEHVAADKERYKKDNISIATFNKKVLITGQVSDTTKKKELGDFVASIKGVDEVYNMLEISPPSPALTRASDSWITTKVKAKLIAMNNIDPSQIKVVTENGTVYLMGIIPPDQADTAIDIAQNTDGVQNVVKVFYYLRVSKT